jgi:hypothetical protein
VKKVSGIDDTARWRNEMTIEAACKMRERAKSLVFQSRNLIETTTLLIGEGAPASCSNESKETLPIWK